MLFRCNNRFNSYVGLVVCNISIFHYSFVHILYKITNGQFTCVHLQTNTDKFDPYFSYRGKL